LLPPLKKGIKKRPTSKPIQYSTIVFVRQPFLKTSFVLLLDHKILWNASVSSY